MPIADPGIALKCRKCSRDLTYITSMSSGPDAVRPGDKVNVKVDTHIYRCQVHGGWRLSPEGQIYPHPLASES
jgi:hypothetical protein